MNGRRFANVMPIVKFLLCGGTCALFSWLVSALLVSTGAAISCAGSAGYVASLPLSFLLHRLFSFESRNRAAGDLVRFLTVAAGSAWLAGFCLSLFSTRGWSLPMAMVLTIAVIAPTNYLAMKLWVFLRRPLRRENRLLQQLD